ncbi:MAG: hypothetical protein NVS4B8_08940 [Herpetosiphon sp.]
MLRAGILNPHINHLLSRIRHTNALVIADRGFPYWPSVETIDITLIDDVPTVLQVFLAIRPIFVIGEVFMAREFWEQNRSDVHDLFRAAIDDVPLACETHINLKKRVPEAIGLIRTGDTIPYANMVLISS